MSTTDLQTAPARVETPAVTTFVPELLHLRKILVPTDMSPPAEKAIRYASQLAEQFGGELCVVHVIEPVYPYPLDGMTYYPVSLPTDPNVARRPELEANLQERADKLAKEHRIKIKTEVRVGNAYDQIVQAARDLEADLVVIATHGYTGLKHFLLGSTAEKVVRHAPCPVLVVREKEREFA
jgi:nucleotide-binding universal stress UspA family protein